MNELCAHCYHNWLQWDYYFTWVIHIPTAYEGLYCMWICTREISLSLYRLCEIVSLMSYIVVVRSDLCIPVAYIIFWWAVCISMITIYNHIRGTAYQIVCASINVQCDCFVACSVLVLSWEGFRYAYVLYYFIPFADTRWNLGYFHCHSAQ